MLLLRVILFSAFLTSAFNAMRLITSLDALAAGASAGEVGLLIALISFMPLFLSMRCGRWIDAGGFHRPVLISGLLLLAAGYLPALLPTARFGFLPLSVSCVLNGLGFMITSIASNYIVGAIAPRGKRTAYFAWFSLGWALSGLIPPVIAGYLIDHWGHYLAFGMTGALATVGLLIYICSAKLLRTIPPIPKKPQPAGALRLLTDPKLGRVLFVSAVVSMAWDLQNFIFPVYGTQIGLSATQIGWMVGTFFLATFLVRFALPFLTRRISEWPCLTAALAIICVSYALFPFFDTLHPLLVVAFVLGTGLGAANPNIMSLVQSESPAGRVGEALGIRNLLTTASHFVLPMAYGTILAAISVASLFYTASALMAAAGVVSLKASGQTRDDPEK